MSETLPPLTPERRVDLRNRVLAGERLDKEITRQIVESMRQGRSAIPIDAPKKARKTTTRKAKDHDAALAEFDSFLGTGSAADGEPGDPDLGSGETEDGDAV
jgi:hypothetical protein